MTTPPYRADIVGGFLRPASLKDARRRHADGALDDAGLRAAEDAAIADLVQKEADAGLRLATDGETISGDCEPVSTRAWTAAPSTTTGAVIGVLPPIRPRGAASGRAVAPAGGANP